LGALNNGVVCAPGSARTLYPPLFKIQPTLGRVYALTNMCAPFQSELDRLNLPVEFGTDFLLAPIFMMTMCARGFILWIINVGLVIYLGVAARKLYKVR
jgi:hypothetical protein